MANKKTAAEPVVGLKPDLQADEPLALSPGPSPVLSEAEVTADCYIVLSPLRHAGVKYMPGDPLPQALLPDDLAVTLLSGRIIRKP